MMSLHSTRTLRQGVFAKEMEKDGIGEPREDLQCSAGRTSFNTQGQQRRNNVSDIVGTEGHDVWSSSCE